MFLPLPSTRGGQVKIRKVGAVALATALLLTGCYEGEVKKRRKVGDQYQVLVETEDGRERWIDVGRPSYDGCRPGNKWPGCGNMGYGNPDADDRIVASVSLSSTARGFLLSYVCPGKEVHRTVNTRSFHSRCMLRPGQRVTVSGAARGASFDCQISILGGEVVDSNIAANSIRCTWVHNR
jgi:hypothetical protein